MRNVGIAVGICSSMLLAGCSGNGASYVEADEEGAVSKTESREERRADPRYVLDHTMARIDGGMEDLSSYEGKVILVVNTASRCGLTGQYEQLEALYREKQGEGFVVLGFPANNFLGQEPGTNLEIAAFCSENYDVTFPMFAKVSVKGSDVAPLYRDLIDLPEPLGGEPGWNFTKFLVGRDGKVIARFAPQMKPDDPELVAAVDSAIAGS